LGLVVHQVFVGNYESFLTKVKHLHNSELQVSTSPLSSSLATVTVIDTGLIRCMLFLSETSLVATY
jgi:hypothetical protein